jgi:hypothetical protein
MIDDNIVIHSHVAILCVTSCQFRMSNKDKCLCLCRMNTRQVTRVILVRTTIEVNRRREKKRKRKGSSTGYKCLHHALSNMLTCLHCSYVHTAISIEH